MSSALPFIDSNECNEQQLVALISQWCEDIVWMNERIDKQINQQTWKDSSSNALPDSKLIVRLSEQKFHFCLLPFSDFFFHPNLLPR